MSNRLPLHSIIEAALMVAGRPLSIATLQKLFDKETQPPSLEIQSALESIKEFYTDRGIELVELATGWVLRSKLELSPWLIKLWEEKPARYSRPLLETLALIAWRQPITRAEIEEVRGVSVSTQIVKTLMEREWIRIIGHRDLPGKPALYGTTKTFLNYFNLKNLNELPSLPQFLELNSENENVEDQTILE